MKSTPDASNVDLNDTSDTLLELNLTTAEPESESRSKATWSREAICVDVPPSVFPRSQSAGWVPPLKPSLERDVIEEFEVSGTSDCSSEDGYISYDLLDFSIYRPHSSSAGSRPYQDADELVSLHNLCAKDGHDFYLFDGLLRQGPGGRTRYVQKIPFKLLSIGNYLDEDAHSVNDNIWIQSVYNETSDIWYRLQDPSPVYRRYHTPFLWVADFTKHFVGFLSCHDQVHLADFKHEFIDWLKPAHNHDNAFRNWLKSFPSTDFTQVVAAQPDFLWKESAGISKDLLKHPIWKESHPKLLDAIKEQPQREILTVVTPFVYECFKRMPWGKFLKPVAPSPSPSPSEESGANRVMASVAINRPRRLQRDKHGQIQRQTLKATDIKVGDVVCVPKDKKTKWKASAQVWFGYVQDIEISRTGKRLLHLLWLYQPSDTTCGSMHYPIVGELFLSDNCNCEDDKYEADEVIAVAPVSFFPQPGETRDEYFVRMKFCSDEDSFLTLRKSDLRCIHHSKGFRSDLEDAMEKYPIGSTVLVVKTKEGRQLLEPMEIIDFQQEGAAELVSCRQLVRKRYLGYKDAPANELVYTDRIESVLAESLARRCYVRFFQMEDDIPAPYCRGGVGDAFYFTSRLIDNQSLERLSSPPTSLIEGFDPRRTPRQPLNGLDLCCGGGNFGRGLEEGGAVQFKWAVDLNSPAMHTYKANLVPGSDTELYLGNMNDFLVELMKKNERLGVDFLSAGSPCQGFSTANHNQDSDDSQRNCSLVASVASYVDVCRPKYAFEENVLRMSKKGKGKNEQNVYSQLVCCLVGLGYQVKQFNIDAWNFGSSQSRSRLFVIAGAPGVVMPSQPPISHAHPVTTRQSSIGLSAHGLPFGARSFEITPFDFVSSEQSTKDLPNIGDARVQTCIPYPDHRTSRVESHDAQVLISQIPLTPLAQNFAKAWHQGRLSKSRVVDSLAKRYENRGIKNFSAYGRLNPHALMPTITTAITPQDAFMGTWLHWNQHRALSLMEARRGQGFPDYEVLIGNTAQKWKQVGNSVARPVALALGLALREAWLANPPDDAVAVDSTVTAIVTATFTSDIVPSIISTSRKRQLDIDDDFNGMATCKKQRSDDTTSLVEGKLTNDLNAPMSSSKLEDQTATILKAYVREVISVD
ncbi:MAG: hypothetical protein M1819_005769 [Sarea resinae]|nr:MAG: hypothetical protein M1819_005769 [Sarea resinae]